MKLQTYHGRPVDLIARMFDNEMLDIDRLFNPMKVKTKERMGMCDMFESDEDYTIKIDAPGLSDEDIEIKIEDGVMNISGQRISKKDLKEETKPVKKDEMILSERSMRRFDRHLSLPKDVDIDVITAKLNKGVLEIKLTKIPEDIRVKKIKITT